MIEERILSAVERIDDAIGRIEAFASRPSSPPTPPIADGADAGALGDLRERHMALRTRVEAAVAELDMLMRNG